MADLRRQLERTMMVQQVQQTEIMQKLQVTDTELKTYYEAHKDEFGTVPQITLREITINVPVTAQGINVAQDDAAKAKAEEVRAKIIAGEPFARLAADYSDSGSKANGGLVGPLAKSDLSEDLQKAIAGLKTGGVTPVLRTARGYQIIKIENLSRTRRPSRSRKRAARSPTRSPTASARASTGSSSPGCAPKRSSTGRTTRSRRPTKSA